MEDDLLGCKKFLDLIEGITTSTNLVKQFDERQLASIVLDYLKFKQEMMDDGSMQDLSAI